MHSPQLCGAVRYSKFTHQGSLDLQTSTRTVKYTNTRPKTLIITDECACFSVYMQVDNTSIVSAWYKMRNGTGPIHNLNRGEFQNSFV